MPDQEKVKVERRRKGSGPEGKPRAAKPTRRPSGTPPSGTKTTSRSNLPIWLIIPLVIIFILFNLLTGGEDTTQVIEPDLLDEDLPAAEIALPTSVPANIDLPISSDGQTWLVMLYQDADDQILEKDIYIDLNEVEKVGSTERVHIVSQVDRYQAAFQGDANWTSTRRYYITRDDNLNRINSQLVQDLGELNMADGQVLVDFAVWAIENFPADKYVLILSDHGMGWPGGWSDPTAGGLDRLSAPLTGKLDDHLWLSEIDSSLETIIAGTGIDKFEIIGFDACLMGQLEVFSMLEPYARYAIASEETEPALGWAYTGFLNQLTSNPDLSGAELSKSIVNSYIVEDQRILDPEAREDFVSQGSPLSNIFGFGRATSQQLTQQLGRNITLSAIDLGKIPGLMEQLNSYVYYLQNEDQSIVASARNYARSYTSIFGRQVPPSFIDLGHFAQLVARSSSDETLKERTNALLLALKQSVISEKHGEDQVGSTGISIYFPNSTLYSSPMAGPQSYVTLVERFANQSLWDDFLAYHYQNQSFEITAAKAVIPENNLSTRAPGKGSISVSDILLSSEVAAPGKPIELEVDIQGKNIGYIYLFVGYYDPGSNSIFIADTDFLESPDTRELDGVYYPVWPEDRPFTLSFEWDPYIFGVTDGGQIIPALFSPRIYGAMDSDAVYTMDGYYTFAGTSDTRYAQMYFRDGWLFQVFGYTTEDETGAPREISPQLGDEFTILDQWIELDDNGGVSNYSSEPGERLIFSNEPFRWEEIYAAPGEYVIGFIIEDLDGNSIPVYTRVIVE